MEEWEEMVNCYKKAIELAPFFRENYVFTALGLFELGKVEEANIYLEKAAASNLN